MDGSIFIEQDPFAPITYIYKISEILYHQKSDYQDIQVLKNDYFGKMLVLDNVIQLTEKDEFFYHEMLAHVAMHAHENPQTVLIIGGGDGGTLREVLKHKSVKQADLIDIDGKVIEVSKQFFPSLSCSFSDKRANVMPMDGAKHIRETKTRYDIVIIDSTDPVGPAKSLCTDEFYAGVKNVLNDTGIFVEQTESIHFHRDFIVEIQEKWRKLFNIVNLFYVPLATYAGNWWTFSIASKKYQVTRPNRKKEIDTRFYDEQVHVNSFVTDAIYQKLMTNKLDW
jgi:spermidine synthase